MFKIFCTYICLIIYKMQHLEVRGAVRHTYIYIYIYVCVCVCVVLPLRVNNIQRDVTVCRCLFTAKLVYMFRVPMAPIM